MGSSESAYHFAHTYANTAYDTLAHVCADRNTDACTNTCACTVFLSSW